MKPAPYKSDTVITFHQAGIGRPPARGPAGRRWPRLAGLDDAAVAFDWAAGPPYSAYAHPVSWTCASCASRVADYGPYSGEREEGHAAGCARVDRERAAHAAAWGNE